MSPEKSAALAAANEARAAAEASGDVAASWAAAQQAGGALGAGMVAGGGKGTAGGVRALPKGITRVKNAKGEVFKEVHTAPSRLHAGMAEHTHPNYRNVLPDGSVRTGVSRDAVPVSRRDIIDATRPGAQRTGVPE